MLANLQKLYTETVLTVAGSPSIPGYFWVESDGEKLGIPSEQLSVAEEQLLKTIYPSADPLDRLNARTKQIDWLRYFTKQGALPAISWKDVRVLHFTVSHTDFSLEEWQDALLSFFQDALLVWCGENQGFILEDQSLPPNDIEEMGTIIQTIEMDFYCRLRFFIGSPHKTDGNLRFHFEKERECFKAIQYVDSISTVHTIQTALPHLLIAGEPIDRQWYIKEVLGEFTDDLEMIKTIKTYLDCNQNATKTAKQLFIHRNSLHYRLDKFIQRTGLNMKQFNEAAIVYLAILLLQQLDK
ncbi:PucR family transcriptional regulator [Bacillus sp. 1P06AnD]|uniref:PucR family transcriptional regulator n=1 Tax=Bacillus sp. 1P06AnD TaxID=3132208 RepID=UPI0039A3976B